MKNFYNFLHRKHCQNWKKRIAFFHYRHRVKVELTCENGKNTSNTGWRGHVWLLVRSSIVMLKKHVLLVRVVWVMRSVIGCHTLNTPIRELIPSFSSGRKHYTFGYIFAASITRAKPEKTTMDPTRICWKFSMTTHKTSSPWQESKRLVSTRKTKRFWTDWTLGTFLTNLDNTKLGADPTRVNMPSDSFFAR